MIRTTGFKRALLMPSNRRPRDSFLNDYVRGQSINSKGFIDSFPCSECYSILLRSRLKLKKF